MARVKLTVRYSPGGFAPRARPHLWRGAIPDTSRPALKPSAVVLFERTGSYPRNVSLVEEEVLESGVVAPAARAIYNEAAAGEEAQSHASDDENRAYVLIPRVDSEGDE